MCVCVCVCVYIHACVCVSHYYPQVMLTKWSFSTLPCHPSLLTGPPDSIQCSNRADVCYFLLLSSHWCVHV